MVEIAISVAAKVVEFLVGPIARPFSYIWNYKTNFDNLKTEVRKLEGQKETVQDSVDSARRNGDQIKQRVSDWLVSVEKITDEASEVIEENQQANMKCFKGLCPNPKRHYQHSRKAVKKAKAIVELYADGNFQTVSIRANPEEIWIPSYKGYMVFESRKSTLKEILDALSNPDVNRVGIYGTGGIGKTTLAREIAGQAEDKKLFNVVAFAEVAMKPDIKEIQQEIADKLGLTFREESASGRARSLQQRLKQEEKVLLVLDNIWERLNLEDVGIPFGNDHKGCKLLLTARSLDVLSNKMDSQSNFKVDFLEKGEAWSLFEKKAGACDRLQALAKNVAEACGGLPIAINSVAVALKTKQEFEWKDALRKLTKPSASNFEGVAAETYSSIEISYSQLKEEELKSTFLLCCMMGYYANVEDLLAYGMGLGMFKYVEAMEDARNRVNTLVQKLKDSSLLLDINNGTFSLHDVVRDVGRSIASRDGHMFTVTNNCIPREWEDKDIMKNCVGISLYNINKLPEEFECPELQFFYVRTTNVPNNFFAGMPKLKVLHLARLELNSVPNSIRLLVNLRTLYIYDCKLRDVDFIGKFRLLEILRIYGSYRSVVEMIPKKMCNLTGLRLLDLSGCSILRNIPPNVLSTFTRLEELYLPAGNFRKCKIEWEVEGVNILDELKHLTLLTALQISIPDANVLPKGCFLLKKLERYEIIIGRNRWSPFYWRHGNSRRVQLNLETSSCCDDVQKFLSALDGRGFPELEYLHVENSPCFRTIVDCLESESCHHFLFLQSLSLLSVLNLEMIHNYPLKDKADSFRQLRTIKVKFCHKLKNILSFSTYRALPLLQDVDVSSCDNMEEIFAIRREEEINNSEGIDQIEFKHLRTITVAQCNKLKNILSFSTYSALPLLQKVDVSTCNNIEEIFAIRREEDINSIEETDQIEFKHLSSLRLNYLPKLTSFCSINSNKDMFVTPTLLFNQKVVFSNLEALNFCSINVEKIWHNELPAISSLSQCLRQLSIKECSTNLKVLFSSSTVAFSSLEVIEIDKMDDLETIWPNQLCNDSFCNLRTLTVTRCNKLLTIFQSNMLDRITRLESLTISDCDLVEEIFDLQEVDFEESLPAKALLRELVINGLPKLKHIWNKDPHKMFSYQKLNGVKVHHCMNLKYLFPVSIAKSLLELQQLVVYHCGVEEIVACDQGEAKVAATFVFPRITSLDLNNLRQLKTFYRGVHTSQWQSLKRLTMCGCDKVELFASELFNFQENNESQHGSSVQPLFIVEKVSFSSLEVIEISEMDGLEMIWSNQLYNDSFCNLKSLKVKKCNKLLTIFQSNMLERILRLESLTVRDCDLVEKIFDLQGIDFEELPPPKETQLRELDINGLPNLKHIWNKDPQKMFSFQKLNNVKVHHCMSLKYLFPVSIAESLSELEQLAVYYCGVEEIVAGDQGEAKVAATFVFPRITSLELTNLPRLKTFYRGIHASQWQNLKRLVMHGCDKVELFASELFHFQENNEGQSDTSVQPLFIVEKVTFPSLEEIKISESNNLKILWQKGAKESFCNLKSMEVSCCNELLTIFQFNTLEGLSMPKLLTVIIRNCASVEEIFDLQKVNFEESQSRAVSYRLQELIIIGLPKLKHIWNKEPQAELSFESLQRVEVLSCGSLKDIFPASIGRSLLQLVKLNVGSCGKLEEIVAKEGEAKEAARFVFPKVTSIRLNGLPELRTFYRGVHSSKWEVLKELKVVGCDKIELLASQLSCFQENNIEESSIDISVQPPFFFVEKDSFPILEKLILIGEGARMISQGQFSEELFCNLKFLRVYNDKSVVPFPLRILQRFCHLHELHLKSSSYKEIFSYEEDETHVGVDSKLDMVLSKLERLIVCNCQNLIQLVPSSTSFQNLTVLKVWNCNGLKNLMTSSTAKRLVQLREMVIGYCKSMIEVVAKWGDITEDKIIFSKLRTLRLGYLPSLSCFCSENYTFELPSLEQLIVTRCPEMKYFSLGDVTTPILHKVQIDWSYVREFTLEGDLNTTIQLKQDSRVSHPYDRKEEDFWDWDLDDVEFWDSEDEDY